MYHRFQSLKILAYSDRLRQVAEGGEPYPIDWHIYPSNVCNHACRFCIFIQNGEQENYPDRLPREVLLRAVRDAKRTGAVLTHFSGGGEPLLNRHTLEAMTLARELGLKVALSTNGTHLTAEVARQVHYLRVSLNAGTSVGHHATNHALRPEHSPDFDRIVANVAAAVPVARAAGNDVGLAFVVDGHNHGEIEPFVKVAADCGVDFVHIRPGFYYDNGADAAVRASMAEAFAACERAKEQHGNRVQIFALTDRFDGYWTPRTYHACRAVWTGLTLRATGDFAVCQDRPDLVWGRQPSYRGGASFEDCWHSEERRALVSSIHDGPGGILPSCPRCVWNGRNTVIEEVFVKDSMRLALV